jgi:hypothetical protein
MGLFMQTPPATLAATSAIREDLNALTDKIRCRADLAPDAVQCLLARAYLKAKSDMDALNTSSTASADARRRALTAQVWGVDDIATNAVDRAAAAVSYRDAQDRAGSLENPHDAANLLTAAERSGDELLARAVASQADTMSWDDVAGEYFATRPAKAAANAELHRLTPNIANMSATDLFMFALPQLLEFGALNDYRIQQIADDPRFTNL